MFTTDLGCTSYSLTVINGPDTEGNLKLPWKGPTSKLWESAPSLCGTTMNTKRPSFMILGVHYNRCLSIKARTD